MSIKKVEYRGYKIKRSGMADIWHFEKPSGVKIYLTETDEQKFAVDQDFRDYIDLIYDLEGYDDDDELEEEPMKLPKYNSFDASFLAKKLQKYK